MAIDESASSASLTEAAAALAAAAAADMDAPARAPALNSDGATPDAERLKGGSVSAQGAIPPGSDTDVASARRPCSSRSSADRSKIWRIRPEFDSQSLK